ncbi:MAG: TlpA disulfide reductase family protein [Bacillota bacterium]
MKGILVLTAVLCSLSVGAFITQNLAIKQNKEQASAKVQISEKAQFSEGANAGNKAYGMKVDPIDKEKLQSIIKNRNGKALLINVWASWCGPCREEFPDLVKLGNDYKGKDLDIIGLSVDDKKEVESKVIPFLKEQKANFTIYINGFKKDSDLIEFFDKKWQGEIPVTLIYDSKGNRKAFLVGMQDYKSFKKEVDAAMK